MQSMRRTCGALAGAAPPVIKGVVEGLEHTVQGPPQAVAITPDGKLAIVGAPTRYDYAAKKGRLVDTGERLTLAAGPVSIRSMPR